MNNFEEDDELIFDVVATTAFKKDKKKYQNSPKKIEKIINVIEILQRKGVEGIPENMRPHYLSGQYSGCLECHIEGDHLIICIQNDGEKVIYLMRLAIHSELFS